MRHPSSHVRLPDWPERLAALIEDRRHAPFEWGHHDCYLFACDGAMAMTGSDPAWPVRGAYADEDGADALIGPDGLEAFVAASLAAWGAVECRPSLAQRGDFIMAQVGNQLVCGLSLGATIVAPTFVRLAFLPASAIVRAWAI